MKRFNKSKKRITIFALIISLLMPMLTIACLSVSGANGDGVPNKSEKYAKTDINELTGHGKEPEELSVSAGATYQEKAWYEYVAYSEKAVASYRLNDDSRLLFYDPYTYTNAMIMDVKFDATTTEFDTMSSYTISHTFSKSINACVESTYTNTTATQSSGKDLTGTSVINGGYTLTNYNHATTVETKGTVKENTKYEYERIDYETTSSTVCTILGSTIKAGSDFGVDTELGINDSNTTNENVEWLTSGVTNTTDYGEGYSTTTNSNGNETLEDHTTSTTTGWTELSDRITKTLGSSSSTSNSWSETEGTTVTKTYAATHFASDGVTPLPWAIVHYSVQMPMKCCLQYKVSGEWTTISTVYCLLTTVKGTCRAWIQNGQTYYEDWGSGEAVVETQFWSQFMTKDQLMEEYSKKLFPIGGDN